MLILAIWFSLVGYLLFMTIGNANVMLFLWGLLAGLLLSAFQGFRFWKTMNEVLESGAVLQPYLGWCPNAPAMRTTSTVLVVPSVTANPAQPAGGAGSTGSIRRGIGIATGSIKTLIRNKRLLWVSLIAGIVMLFLITAEANIVANSGSALPFLVGIPIMDSFLVFDTRIFLLQAVCLSCFNLLLAGLVLYRSHGSTGKFLKIRDAFSVVNPHASTIAFLSIVMAVAGTIIEVIVNQTQLFGKIVFSISMVVFYLPYAYYLPDILSSALFFSVIIMSITILQFLLALYVVPVIVLENKGLFPALAVSVTLMKKTWREWLGCILVYGVIALGVAAIAVVIGQSPLLLNHDYDFFLSLSRGQVLMTVVCYGFLLACGVLTAIGSTIFGIAVADLYACGETDTVHSVPESETTAVAEPAR
jgi:hypothetical protein